MGEQRPLDVTPLPRVASAPQRRVFVRGLLLDAYIGAYETEKSAPQPVRIDLELDVIEPANPESDKLEDVVCYDRMTQGVKSIIAQGHIKLVETLAEKVASLALAHPMVLSVMVRITKPNAIDEAEAAGVEITRKK
ncbi:dihydroneopterin aldolase [Hyphococcus flavus]|uniref:7,8-dihydroneopterin aldolase n=1 Tax=Hyphococcus flavus TaxID=1866326 RepID=A0AAF0CER1_9PROT|nr:dihydroneopterin aldolase [Hyphococcus flavus]WDI30599.1 dihydroneopterin aldolase [Hyphococcus flavus]